MNILVVSQYFWPESFRINELAVELAERGHRVTVLTGYPNYPEGQVFPAFRQDPGAFDRIEEVRVVRVPLLPRGRGSLRLFLNYLSFVVSACTLGIWRLRGQTFDVILAFEPSPITVGIPSALMRWLKGAPQVFWVLDLWPETLRAVGALHSERLLLLVGRGVAWIYRRCDLILAQSRSFIANIRHYAGNGPRIEYFPAWTDEVFGQEAQAMPAPEVPSAPGVFTVLFAGNVGEAQDFPAVLDAAERLRERDDIRWLIVGDGRMASWVREEIDRRDLRGRVVMVGRFPLERMPSFFAHADALLVSLRADPIFAMTIPGKIQTYLGAGLPVLAMLDGEGARIVAEAEAGLICAAGDGAALAANVIRLAGLEPADRHGMGESGRRMAMEAFDRRTLINRLEGWLIELVAVRRREERGTG